jgi:hypothetical protein
MKTAKMKEIKEQWKEHCKKELRILGKEAPFVLFGVDCGGYDITGSVKLIMKDDHFVLQFNDGDEGYYDLTLEEQEGKSYWVPRAEFKLIPNG